MAAHVGWRECASASSDGQGDACCWPCWSVPASAQRPLTGRLCHRRGAPVAGVELWVEVPLHPGEAEVDRFVTPRVRSDVGGFVAFVSERATVLVLLRDGAEWRRVPLAWGPDGELSLRP
jgi:hypothetical protein